MAEADLKGIKVLVTRPEHQAHGLCQALEKSGATPLPFPVIEITEPKDSNKTLELLQQLDKYQWLIFISANAAERGIAMLQQNQIALPENIRIAAVGASTANKLKELKVENVVTPDARFDSEGLLELPEFTALQGQKILIMRGEGGREALADTLRQRGAEVDYAEVYQRSRPNKKLDGLDKQGVDIALVTSNEGLTNLWNMASRKQHEWLKQLPLVVMSERNREHAHKLGYKADILVAQQQSDDGLLAALKLWYQAKQQEKAQMAQKETQQKAEKSKKLPEKAAANQTQQSQNSKISSKGLLIAILALLVAGGASAAIYQLWQQQDHFAAQIDQQLGQINQHNSTLDGSVQQLNNGLSSNGKQQQVMAAELESLKKENALLWQNLREMQQQDGHDKRPWQLAEAAYLMRLANHRLQLERDVTGAIAGLQVADQILKQVADPALLAIREQLTRELTQLKMLETPDREGLSAQLIALAESVRQLPIKGVDLVELHNPDEPQQSEIEEQPKWQGVLDRVWTEMRTLVVITRNDQPVMPLIPADQRSYLYQNVELQLESARLAMLQGDQNVWQASLSYSRNWLFDYFDHQMPSVKSSIELLRELEKVNVSPALPDISASLRELTKHQQRLDNNQPAAVGAQSESVL